MDRRDGVHGGVSCGCRPCHYGSDAHGGHRASRPSARSAGVSPRQRSHNRHRRRDRARVSGIVVVWLVESTRGIARGQGRQDPCRRTRAERRDAILRSGNRSGRRRLAWLGASSQGRLVRRGCGRHGLGQQRSRQVCLRHLGRPGVDPAATCCPTLFEHRPGGTPGHGIRAGAGEENWVEGNLELGVGGSRVRKPSRRRAGCGREVIPWDS